MRRKVELGLHAHNILTSLIYFCPFHWLQIDFPSSHKSIDNFFPFSFHISFFHFFFPLHPHFSPSYSSIPFTSPLQQNVTYFKTSLLRFLFLFFVVFFSYSYLTVFIFLYFVDKIVYFILKQPWGWMLEYIRNIISHV